MHFVDRGLCYSGYRVSVVQAACLLQVHNVMSCPVLVRKRVGPIWVIYKRAKASKNCIVPAICGSDIWWKSFIIIMAGMAVFTWLATS